MKTVVIWNTFGEEQIKFFVLDGDYSHLNETYLNSMDNEANQDELNEILAYDDKGKPKVNMLVDFPLPIAIEDKVIVCGFIP